MVSCALIGPDGAGKTTVCRQLERELPVATRYIYMGVSAGSSNVMLPTTRLIRALKRALGAPPDSAGPRPHAAALTQRPGASPATTGRARRSAGLRTIRSAMCLAHRIAEEWYRQARAWYHGWRGRVVVFDRHFFADYHAYDIVGAERDGSRLRRLHGWMLERVFPRPTLVVYLDAPAEVLLARKGEGTRALLERRRLDYLQLRDAFESFHVVDANRPLHEVTREVSAHILEHLARERSHGPRLAASAGSRHANR